MLIKIQRSLFRVLLAQKEHFQDVCKLGRGDLVGHADVMEEFGGDEGGRWDETGSLFSRMCLVRVWVYVDLVLDEFGVEDVIIGSITEAVECLVGVLDG